MDSRNANPDFTSGIRSRIGCAAFALSALLLTAAFAIWAETKPVASWSFLDLFSETALAVLAAAWCVVVLDSRPGGRVTSLLGAGLAGLALAGWADALDEVFRVPVAYSWLGSLESVLMPLGIVALGAGLGFWRQEQFVLGEQLGARERGLRDHRRIDRLTRLADAAYLREQMATEARQATPCTVAMFEIRSVMDVQRRQGERAAARLLQSVAQQLLINLRPDDLVCRYAGDRLVVLLPHTGLDEGRRRVEHLRRMVAATQVHVAAWPDALPVEVHVACGTGGDDAQATLSALGRELDPIAGSAQAA
jgi:diguanylate cyclase (GGDEF)-like protein